MHSIYSIFDSKSGIFSVPYFVINDNVALRSFADVVNDPSTTVFRHPTDYVLYKIGEFDDSTGRLTSITPVLSLGNAGEFKRDRAPLEFARSLANVVQADVKNGTEEVLK